MKRTLVALLAIVTSVVVVALFAWASTTHFGSDLEAPTITATTGFVGPLAGAVTATTITASSTAVISGAFDARSTAEFAGVVTCSSAVAFQDSVYFGDDVIATTFTGALTGDVNAGTVESDTLDITGSAVGVGKPALPTASVHAGRFATNAAADTLYWSDGTNWQQVAP